MVDLNRVMSKARVRLVARVPFFGYLAMQLRFRAAKPEDNVPTAGITPDGLIILNEEYVAKLTDKEVCGLLAHEVMHPALFFWARKFGRMHELWNIAHDLSFNYMIEEMAGGEIKLPEGGLLDPKFHGMASEEIYSYLRKGDDGSGKTTIQCKGGGSITVDTSGKGGDGYIDCRQDLSDSDTGKKAAKGDRASQSKLNQQWKLNIATAAQQHQQRCKSQGRLPAGLQRFIDELLHPQLEWHDLLRKWCGDNGRREMYSFARPNRRSHHLGIVLPSPCAGGLPDVIFLLDSSGSMGDQELKQARGECFGILEELGSEVRVIVCDADVHVDVSVEDAMEFEMKGGGGSDFRPAFDLIAEDGFDGAVIAFTDGMISVPSEMPHNLKGVLWITDEHYKAPTESWGEHITIKIRNEDEAFV